MLEIDVVAIGAGPAGAIATLTLAQSGRSVLLIDDLPSPASEIQKIGESLIGAARPLLRNLGLLPLVEAGPHLPCYGNRSAWGSKQLIETDFIRDPHGPGWHLDRGQFDAALRQAAVAAGAQWRSARLRTATWNEGKWQIQLADGEVQARWSIDATGRRAVLARSQGAVRQRDDDLVALYVWVKDCQRHTDSRTLVESTADGWWYTARLPNGFRVVALHVDAEEAVAIRHQAGAWQDCLSRTVHLHPLLAEENAKGSASAKPLLLAVAALKPTDLNVMEACGARLDRFYGSGWLATGDASLSFDPLSSQGIFNALYTGMKAGQTVQAALNGQFIALTAYADRLEQIRAAYLRHHRLFYQSEHRWRDRAFWSKRQR